MRSQAVVTFVLLASVASFLSYKVGSSPIALAKSRSAQESAGAVPPPLPAAPTTWTLQNAGGGVSETILVTKPAGGTGVKHVATCVVGTFISASTSAQSIGLQLRDGDSSGPILLQWEGKLPSVGTFPPVNLCDLNVVGSANTAMTLMFVATPSISGTIGLVGYDAQ